MRPVWAATGHLKMHDWTVETDRWDSVMWHFLELSKSRDSREACNCKQLPWCIERSILLAQKSLSAILASVGLRQMNNLGPRPHQQQCRTFIVKFCPFDNVECCFDIVAVFGNIVAETGNSVEATFDVVERIVQFVAFDNVAWTFLLVWTGPYMEPCSVVWSLRAAVRSSIFLSHGSRMGKWQKTQIWWKYFSCAGEAISDKN